MAINRQPLGNPLGQTQAPQTDMPDDEDLTMLLERRRWFTFDVALSHEDMEDALQEKS